MGNLRIDLPSGGWWEFRDPHLYATYQRWRDCLPSPEYEGRDASDISLLAVTAAWSFGEVTYDALGERDIEDVLTAFAAYAEQITPFFFRKVSPKPKDSSSLSSASEYHAST